MKKNILFASALALSLFGAVTAQNNVEAAELTESQGSVVDSGQTEDSSFDTEESESSKETVANDFLQNAQAPNYKTKAAEPEQQATTGSIRGRLIDRQGHNVPNVTVVWTNNDTHETLKTQTNENGGYVLSDVPAGNYTLSVDGGDKFVSLDGVDTSSRETPVTIHVTPGVETTIHNKAYVGDSQEEQNNYYGAGAHVLIKWSGRGTDIPEWFQNAKLTFSNGNSTYEVSADTKGNFELPLIGYGEYEYTLTLSDGRKAKGNDTVRFDPNKESELTYNLRNIETLSFEKTNDSEKDESQLGTGSIRGRIIDEKGHSVPGVTVVWTNIENGETEKTRTDENGNYKLTNVPVGDYALSVSDGEGNILLTDFYGNSDRSAFAIRVLPDVEAVTRNRVDGNYSGNSEDHYLDAGAHVFIEWRDGAGVLPIWAQNARLTFLGNDETYEVSATTDGDFEIPLIGFGEYDYIVTLTDGRVAKGEDKVQFNHDDYNNDKYLSYSLRNIEQLSFKKPAKSENDKPQLAPGSIRGSVIDDKGYGVPNVSVVWTNINSGKRKETKTDKDGNYNLTGVVPGDYVLFVRDGKRNLPLRDVLGGTHRRAFAVHVNPGTESVVANRIGGNYSSDKADIYQEAGAHVVIKRENGYVPAGVKKAKLTLVNENGKYEVSANTNGNFELPFVNFGEYEYLVTLPDGSTAKGKTKLRFEPNDNDNFIQISYPLDNDYDLRFVKPLGLPNEEILHKISEITAGEQDTYRRHKEFQKLPDEDTLHKVTEIAADYQQSIQSDEPSDAPHSSESDKGDLDKVPEHSGEENTGGIETPDEDIDSESLKQEVESLKKRVEDLEKNSDTPNENVDAETLKQEIEALKKRVEQLEKEAEKSDESDADDLANGDKPDQKSEANTEIEKALEKIRAVRTDYETTTKHRLEALIERGRELDVNTEKLEQAQTAFEGALDALAEYLK